MRHEFNFFYGIHVSLELVVNKNHLDFVDVKARRNIFHVSIVMIAMIKFGRYSLDKSQHVIFCNS